MLESHSKVHFFTQIIYLATESMIRLSLAIANLNRMHITQFHIKFHTVERNSISISVKLNKYLLGKLQRKKCSTIIQGLVQ